MFADSLGPIPGMAMAFPDVCLTPAGPVSVPIPYPNIALTPMGLPPAFNIMFQCTPAHNLLTIVPLSLGDSAGVQMGVASGMIMGPRRCLTGATTVLLKGVPATRMTSQTLQNSTNAPGMRLSPSQVKVLLLAP